MRKRIISLALALMMIVTGCITSGSVSAKAAEADSKELKAAVTAMKQLFGIGKEYTHFSYDKYDNDNGAFWYLYWNTEDYSDGINLTCDEKFRIYSYSVYNDRTTGAPKYTREELKDESFEMLKKLAGAEAAGKCELESVNTAYWGSYYTYNYVRVENGIKVPENRITVGMNYVTGEIAYFNSRWLYDVKVPSAKGIMTKEEAAEKLGEYVKMNLVYYIKGDDESGYSAYLAYVPEDGYLAINAKTGKIYTEKVYWADGGDDDEYAEAESTESNMAAEKVELSEKELKEIENAKDLITAKQAIKLIKNNKSLYRAGKITDTEAELMQVGEKYVWAIRMYDNRNTSDGDYYRIFIYTTVDAKTGEILSYSSSAKDYWDNNSEPVGTVKFSEEECAKKFEAFVASQNEEYAKNIRLNTSSKSRPIDFKMDTEEYVYGAYWLNYDRVNAGTPVSGNCVYGEVDSITGKIISYATNWTENLKFESKKDIIDEKAAVKSYTACDGFDVRYEIYTKYIETANESGDGSDYQVKNNLRLVYSTEIDPAIISAKTGKQLNYDGSEYVKADEILYSYDDIAGTKYERAIELLAALGYGFEGKSFEPDKAITDKEFFELLNEIADSGRVYIDYNTSIRYVQKFDSKYTGKTLTRQDAAVIIADLLGYSKINGLGIYKTNFTDESAIAADKLGSVAIVTGLGYMGAASGTSFMPEATVSRGEAAQIIINYLG